MDLIEIHNNNRKLESFILSFFILFELLILYFKPINNAVYSSLSLVVLISVIWVYWAVRHITVDNFFKSNYTQIWLLFLVVRAVGMLIFLDWDAELVHVYESLFDTMESGNNPYKDPTIYHRLIDGSVIYGYFNYPPGEIIFYWITYKIFNDWNYGLIIITNLTINIIILIVLAYKTQDISWRAKLPYFLTLLVINLHNSASTIFLSIIMAALIILNNPPKPSKLQRLLLIVSFAFGLISKFYMIPFVGVYFWYKIIDCKNREYIIDALLTITFTIIALVPFGIMAVFDNTVIFNLNLDTRQEFTTYYPNILSFVFYYFNIKLFYSISAIILLLFSLIITRKMEILERITIILALSLLVFPTPEDQYLGSLIGILFLSKVKQFRLINDPINPSELSS